MNSMSALCPHPCVPANKTIIIWKQDKFYLYLLLLYILNILSNKIGTNCNFDCGENFYLRFVSCWLERYSYCVVPAPLWPTVRVSQSLDAIKITEAAKALKELVLDNNKTASVCIATVMMVSERCLSVRAKSKTKFCSTTKAATGLEPKNPVAGWWNSVRKRKLWMRIVKQKLLHFMT